MRKKALVAYAFITRMTTVLAAAEETTIVVRLSDGTVLVGSIVETDPDGNIVFTTHEGLTFTISSERIIDLSETKTADLAFRLAAYSRASHRLCIVSGMTDVYQGQYSLFIGTAYERFYRGFFFQVGMTIMPAVPIGVLPIVQRGGAGRFACSKER